VEVRRGTRNGAFHENWLRTLQRTGGDAFSLATEVPMF